MAQRNRPAVQVELVPIDRSDGLGPPEVLLREGVAAGTKELQLTLQPAPEEDTGERRG